MAGPKRQSPASRADAPPPRTPAEVARAGYEAWNTGDVEAALEYMHPDLVWKTTGVFPGLSKTYSGHDGFRRFWAEFTEPWETLEIGIEELYELDEETVLVRLRFYARGRQGIEVELPITNHLTIRDGKLVLFQGWPEWDQALSALGIEDPRGGGRS